MRATITLVAACLLFVPAALADDCYEYYNSIGQLVAACPGDSSYNPPPPGQCITTCDADNQNCVSYCN